MSKILGLQLINAVTDGNHQLPDVHHNSLNPKVTHLNSLFCATGANKKDKERQKILPVELKKK